jgi:hypothetical protein
MRVAIRIPRMARWPKGYPAHGQGFDNHSESPRQAWPNRVHLRYGLVILLRLLSTPPFGNAVTTVGYWLITTARQGTHTLLIKPLRGRTSAVPAGAALAFSAQRRTLAPRRPPRVIVSVGKRRPRAPQSKNRSVAAAFPLSWCGLFGVRRPWAPLWLGSP